MRKNNFDGLELPDGVVKATASVADDSQKAGATGAPVSVDSEAEPAPASSDSPLEEDARVDEAYHKLEILAKIEPALNDFYVRLGSMVEVTEDIKLIVGSAVARYLVTEEQVKNFENDFVNHFDKALLAKAKTELQTFAFDLEHTRKEEVQKFNQELKNGWWFFAHCLYSEVLRRASSELKQSRMVPLYEQPPYPSRSDSLL